ncbi:MAG: DegT/DnrJ/EryC1/StrS family aminotransferase [Candidatus Pacebacteria bacterium]|nr:DegT/DnrJ/EryC1/StrS family aminotransferase [Candidatus Paceibacterota bacterium]
MQFLDLKKQYKSIKKEIDQAIKNVLENSVFIGGPEVEKFENDVAKFCGVNYAVGVNSGTDALYLSLKALGITKGDEVITTPFTFIATADVIANCGAKPVFVDINPETYNIDVSKIEENITKKTKAILPVHLFGQMADMGQIIQIARKYRLKVVEDVAQAISAKIKIKNKWKRAGSIGDFGCFSFFPSKNLGAYGDGGMVVTNSKKLADRIKLLRSHGSSPREKYKNLILGTNSRLDATQAAILNVKLKYLDSWSKARAEKASYYSKNINKITSEIITPEILQDRNHVFHQYTLRIGQGKRNKIVDYLNSKGIPTMIYYPLPLHMQPALSYLKYKKNSFPETERASNEVFSLPIYPEIPKSDQDFIIKSIEKFFNK